METFRRSYSPVLFGGLCCAFVLLACSDPAIHEPEGPTLPTSNDRIVTQATFGSPHLTSTMRGLCDGMNGGFHFWGLNDGTYSVGTLGAGGQVQWAHLEEGEASIRDLILCPENGLGLSEAVLWAGGVDKDGDDSLDECLVRVIGSGGEDVSQLNLPTPGARSWLNAVAVVESFGCIAVGGATVGGSYRPAVATFTVGPDGVLGEGHIEILEELQGEIFDNVLVDPDGVSADQVLFYVSTERVRGTNDGWDAAIRAVRGSRTGDPGYNVEWTVDIQEEGDRDVRVSLGAFALHGGTIYLAGAREIVTDPAPSSGYWTAGIVGAVSTSGNLNWLKTISASRYSDRYYGLCVGSDAVYACGRYSGYVMTSSGERHGFGWISMFDPGTGEEMHHIGLGGDEYSSGFRALLVENSDAYCAGWTHGTLEDDGNQAWFAEVDLAGLDNASVSELPGLLPLRSSGEQVDRSTEAIGGGGPAVGRATRP